MIKGPPSTRCRPLHSPVHPFTRIFPPLSLPDPPLAPKHWPAGRICGIVMHLPHDECRPRNDMSRALVRELLPRWPLPWRVLALCFLGVGAAQLATLSEGQPVSGA